MVQDRTSLWRVSLDPGFVSRKTWASPNTLDAKVDAVHVIDGYRRRRLRDHFNRGQCKTLGCGCQHHAESKSRGGGRFESNIGWKWTISCAGWRQRPETRAV